MSESRVIPGGFDRVSTILALVPLLDQFDVELDSVLADCNLAVTQFDDPDNLIPFREGSRLLGLCADRAACESLGLLIGKNTTLESFGIVAELTRSAPDVRGALRLLSRHLNLTDGVGLLSLTESGNFATLDYALYEPGVERADIIYDIVLATSWNILRTLCGNRWLPAEVLFIRSSPADCKPYRKCFQAPLRFDMEHSALVFRREWLDVLLATSDPLRQQALEASAHEIELCSMGNLLSQVRRILRHQLLHGGKVSMQVVAGELNMHRRTVDRRLRADNTSFRSILSELRFEVAKQLLATQMPVSDIALHLQYANPAACTRAFRRWSGVTPTEWRTVRTAAVQP